MIVALSLAPPAQGIPPSTNTIWNILGVIAAAGAVGGIINALLCKSGGFRIPRFAQPQGVFQPGFLGNLIIGAFASVTTWGLYGPLKDAVLLGTNPANGLPANLTVTALVGAALTGVGGARVITNEVDKIVLKKAATEAAGKPRNTALAATIASSRPFDALTAAMDAPG
jgi:hypothetical protein